MNEYENRNDTQKSPQQEPEQAYSPFQNNPYTYYAGYSGGQPNENAPMPKPKKKRTWVKMLAVALCCSLLGGVIGAGGVLTLQNVLRAEPAEKAEEDTENLAHVLKGQRENSVIDIVQIDTSKQMTPAEVYATNVNSTVGITTSITTNFWGYQSTSAASGSGFIISDNGYILTNYHVIAESDSISVSTYDDKSYDATLIGYDESNDIAVLKIEAEDLVPVVLGDSDNLNIGDNVVAIGNPLGELTFTLTAGTISAKDREVTFSNNTTMNLLQTDCAINSGNSGGALFNLYGEVIGVTNAKYSGSSSTGEASIDNIGFAIPINSIMPIVESIIEKGYISKPYVGISIVNVSEEAQQYGIPAGVAIQAVVEDGPAAQAGLQEGDIVTAVNGEAMTNTALVSFIGASSVGDEVVFSIYRKGENMEITVTVGEQVQSALAQEENQQDGQQQYPGNYPWGNSGRP